MARLARKPGLREVRIRKLGPTDRHRRLHRPCAADGRAAHRTTDRAGPLTFGEKQTLASPDSGHRAQESGQPNAGGSCLS